MQIFKFYCTDLAAEESTHENQPIDLNDEKNIEQEKEVSDQHIENNEKVQDDEPLDKPNISEGPLTTTVEDSTVSQNFKKKSYSFSRTFSKSHFHEFFLLASSTWTPIFLKKKYPLNKFLKGHLNLTPMAKIKLRLMLMTK